MRMKKILVKSKGGSKVTREGRINQPAINSLEKKRPGKDIEGVEDQSQEMRKNKKKMKPNKEGNGQQHRPGSQEKQIERTFLPSTDLQYFRLSSFRGLYDGYRFFKLL